MTNQLQSNSVSRKNKLKFYEVRQLTVLAIPAIISQLAQAGLGMIDTIMAGNYSADALAAIAIGTSLFHPVIVLIIGIMMVLNPLTAQYNGEKDWLAMRELFHNGLVLALILVIPSAALLLNAEHLMALMGTKENLIPIIQEYLDALCWGLPGLYLFFALRFTNEGLFNNKLVMYIALSSLPLNVIINYWFIFGGFGIEPMGAVGVGWATFVVYTYMFLSLLYFTVVNRKYSHIKLFEKWHKPNITTLKMALKIGVPMGLSMGLEVSLFAAVGLMISSYAINEIGGHQIALNISSMCYMLPLGLSVAITARVGYHMGTKKPHRAKIAGYSGIAMALVIMTCSMLMLISFPNTIVGFYTKEAEVIAIAVQLLFFSAMFQLSDGTNVASISALRGLKDTKIPFYFSVLAYWIIGFPAGYYLAEKLNWGLTGYWTALITGLSIAAVLMVGRFVILINQKQQPSISQTQS